jgi:hypothetical protein
MSLQYNTATPADRAGCTLGSLPMPRRRRELKITLIILGIVILATALSWPRISLWYARRQVLARIDKLDEGDKSPLKSSLATDVKDISSPPAELAETVSYHKDGYVFSLPAGEYRRCGPAEKPMVLRSDRLLLMVGRVRSQTPAPGGPPSPGQRELTRYYHQTDPYRILVDAFTTGRAEAEAARTRAELQKVGHLITLRTMFHLAGSEKLWTRFTARGHKGFLSGDTTSGACWATYYLPESRKFVEVVLHPRAEATMDDVWSCLARLAIEKQPKAPATQTAPAR